MRNITAVFLLTILVILLLVSIIGQFMPKLGKNPNVTVHLEKGTVEKEGHLFVLIHGSSPKAERLDRVATTLKSYGDVVRVEYPAGIFSNADAMTICELLNEKLELEGRKEKYSNIILVAHSVGALVARRTLLKGLKDEMKWADKTTRVVLLAGANRGWSSGGEKPADLDSISWMGWRLGEWWARLTGVGTFILQFQAGSPFVANLRLDWMRDMRDAERKGKTLEVIQLLGDIDDIVSKDDSEDLRVIASKKFALLRVRGTGHDGMIMFDDKELGNYREEKLKLAATKPFDTVLKQNEEQPFSINRKIKSIVFVLHGIRDLGEWSSKFEKEIRSKLVDNVAIVSPRYGYLGMGPFLLPEVRKKYVRWLMDEYTETLARYPEVDHLHIYFFGHSNGTILLADALETYTSMLVSRVVFAGSVVPRDYDWVKVLENQKKNKVQMGVENQQKNIVQMGVRNYVGTGDWVVAWFPGLFELFPFKRLRNKLGSAGFNGFDVGEGCTRSPALPQLDVTNVCYVKGGHSAFESESRIKEIVNFMLDSSPPDARPPAALEDRTTAESMLGLHITIWAVWFSIVALVLYVGIRVVSSSPSPSWIVLVLYIFLIIRILQLL